MAEENEYSEVLDGLQYEFYPMSISPELIVYSNIALTQSGFNGGRFFAKTSFSLYILNIYQTIISGIHSFI